MLKRIAGFALLFVVMGSIPSFAAMQRLVLGDMNILIDPPEEFKIIPSYCVDFGRVGPRAGVAYGSLLSGPETARVVVDGRELSLQQAIDEHIIRLEGVAPSMKDFNQQVRAYQLTGVGNDIFPKTAVHDLQTMPAAHQKQFLSRHQNFNSLKIVNLAKKQLKITLKNAVVGTTKEATPDWKLPAIPAKADVAAVQSSIWITETQFRLNAQGIKVPINGKLDPATKAGLQKFQQAHKLRANGIPVIETVRALRGGD